MHSLARLVLTLLVGATRTSVVYASNIVELEEFNFDRWVGNGKSALIEFWAPWCDHCLELAPTYQELADAYDHVTDKLVIAKVNADVLGSKSLLEKYGVAGLPTIKWIGADGETEDYGAEAGRTLEDLVEFVTKKSGLKSNLPGPPPPPPSITTQLTLDTFDKIVNDPDKDVLVAFTALWCGHCQALKPIYDLVAWRFRSEDHVVLANLDGDSDPDHTLAKKYDVKGFPILKLFPKGSSSKEPIDYKFPRDEKHLVKFLNENTGTQRVVGGGLTSKAGRSAHLDDLASDFLAARPSERKSIYKRAKTAALSAGKSGKQYLRIMDKLIDGTDEYLSQEKTRLLGILKKRALADEKLDEIQIRSNILAAFTSPAAGKISEGVRIERSSDHESATETGLDEAVETEVKRIKEEL